MRRIAAVTFARSEYGSFAPVMRQIKAAEDLELQLVVAGTHLCPQFGMTVGAIERDGFAVAERVQSQLASDSAEETVAALGLAAIGFAGTLRRLQPDIILLVGDRFELLSIASAALAFRIPVAHISGGEVTEGAIDNQVRYAVTQMSHLHFVAMEEHAQRLVSLGEEPWRVTVTGEPALDSLRQTVLLSRQAMEKSLGLQLAPPVLLVTYHPTTLGSDEPAQEIARLLEALEGLDGTLVFTAPNSDTGGHEIREQVGRFAAKHPNSVLVESLGQQRFYSLLAVADAMVGNSSSGIWEAPSFHLPVLNIGERQRGRIRAANVIDAPCDTASIRAALARALRPEYRRSLEGAANPYGDGHASERIVRVLRETVIGVPLLRKQHTPPYPQQTRPPLVTTARKGEQE